MIYFLLSVIIFMLFVWDILLFSHHTKVSKKLNEILQELKREEE